MVLVPDMATQRHNAKISSGPKAQFRVAPSISRLLLDRRNVALLQFLQAEPRITVTELSRRMKMSPPAARERLLRLEEAGVISGWRVDLDPVALGHPVLAYVRVRPMPGQLPKVAELAQRTPQVVECHRVTGEDCFVMKVYARAVDDFDSFLDKFLVYGQTTTSIVQSTPVPARGLPLPGLGR